MFKFSLSPIALDECVNESVEHNPVIFQCYVNLSGCGTNPGARKIHSMEPNEATDFVLMCWYHKPSSLE